MPALATSPWDKAVARFSDKSIVGSKLRTADWARVPIALRERAFFSAGVENARVLSTMREKILQGMQQERPGGTGMNRSRFVADMRTLLGADEGDSGKLTDLTSRRRLELIWDFQQADAHAQAAHVAGLDPDVQDAYPALRLIRIESRRVERKWFDLWGVAGAKVNWVGASKTEMVALRTSPIWATLSRFQRPWPPFDFGSGMGLEEVDRDETERLGLLPANEPPAERARRLHDNAAAAQRDWNENLSASVKGLSPDARGWLQNAFGDQLTIAGDRAVWKGDRTARPAAALPDLDTIARDVAQATSRDQAHALVALPAADRGQLSLQLTKATKTQGEKAAEFIGSLLHKDAATSTPAKVRITRARAHYHPVTKTAKVPRNNVEITVHELAHHIETSDPEIFAECRAFLASRTRAGETPQRLSALTGSSAYGYHEIAIEDEWARRGGHVYTGKIYPSAMQSTEILSMGLQRLYRDPIGFARQDPDYFTFVLKTLRPTAP